MRNFLDVQTKALFGRASVSACRVIFTNKFGDGPLLVIELVVLHIKGVSGMYGHGMKSTIS